MRSENDTALSGSVPSSANSFCTYVFFCSASVRQIAVETENKPRLHFLDDKGWQASEPPPSVSHPVLQSLVVAEKKKKKIK